MDECFVIRVMRGQAVAVIAGPLPGEQAYEALVRARISTEDGSTVVLLPSGIMSEILSRVAVAV